MEKITIRRERKQRTQSLSDITYKEEIRTPERRAVATFERKLGSPQEEREKKRNQKEQIERKESKDVEDSFERKGLKRTPPKIEHKESKEEGKTVEIMEVKNKQESDNAVTDEGDRWKVILKDAG